MARHRSSAVPLAWLYAALIVYASLYPFEGWRAAIVPVTAFLALPWPRWWTTFDLVSNLLGYMPLGMLVCLAWVRHGGSLLAGFAATTLMAATLSVSMELLQNFLPQRVPSNIDLLLNTAGAAIGAGMGLAAHRLGVVNIWQAVRDRWFVERSAGGVALLVLWPVGLLFPAPVVLGLGQFLGRVRDFLAGVLEGTTLGDGSQRWLAAGTKLDALSPGTELVAVTLGLLGPCLVGFTFTKVGWRRLVLVLWVASMGFATTTLSTALNFGPQHALAWSTLPALTAFVCGMAVSATLVAVPARVCAGLGLVVLTASVAFLAQAPVDPYFSQSLQGWEQGRFIRFHGAAQWVGWMWPYAALVYLLVLIGGGDRR